MSAGSVVACDWPAHDEGDCAMQRPDVPFPKHWLYYIVIKLLVLAGGVALALRLYDVW